MSNVKVSLDWPYTVSYGCLLMVNGNIWPNLAPLRDIRFLKCG